MINIIVIIIIIIIIGIITVGNESGWERVEA